VRWACVVGGVPYPRGALCRRAMRFLASGGGRGGADYPIERTCTADIRHNPSREATNRIYPEISIQRQAVTSRRKGRSTRTGPCLSEYPHGPRGKSKRLEQKTANAEFAVGRHASGSPAHGSDCPLYDTDAESAGLGTGSGPKFTTTRAGRRTRLPSEYPTCETS